MRQAVLLFEIIIVSFFFFLTGTAAIQSPVSMSTSHRQGQEEEVIRVHYGYFPEARPIHAACARGWLDLRLGNRLYEVTCYPQTSGNFAASRLDSGQLQIANLGSTPLAQAIARGIDLKVVYISHYMGESQGIYVRGPESSYTPVVNPFDLVNRTIGVPFGSTMHYQVLFLLDLFSLSGTVNVVNLAPSQIIEAWNNREIDAAACWGVARDFVLQNEGSGNPDLPPAGTLMSAGVLSNWGRPTFVVVAANRQFAEDHAEFVRHFLAVLSRINDSFVDRLGQDDEFNVERWRADNQETSLVPSMADALMNPEEVRRNPSEDFLNLQRRTLDLFLQLTADEQLSCQYLQASSEERCPIPSLQHVATFQTAQFLLDQKLISNLGVMEGFDESVFCPSSDGYCGSVSPVFDGNHLAAAQEVCDDCYPAGPYGELSVSDETLLPELERLDIEAGTSRFAASEIGRYPSNDPNVPYDSGDSTCSGHEVVKVGSGAAIGDGANAEPGKTYSANIACSWELRAPDCEIPDWDLCESLVTLEMEALRIWSGDFVRVYADTNNHCDNNVDDPSVESKVLLAQFSGFDNENTFRQTIQAQGCLLVTFMTDANLERSYGDFQNMGNGFRAIVRSRQVVADCNGFRRTPEGLCLCDGFHWGADCSFTDHCLGTNKLSLAGDVQTMASSENLLPESLENIRDSFIVDPSIAYPNDLDCTYEFQLGELENTVEVTIYYDLEEGHDYIWLESGKGETYYVLTGKHEGESERYYIPVDYLSKTARLRLTTDSRGRRGGFYAEARAVSLTRPGGGPNNPCELGYFGNNCEIPYCQPTNIPLRVGLEDISQSHLLGRVSSQASDRTVRPMPWAPSGGCEWGFELSLHNKDPVAVRLVVDTFDLEAYPETAPGDKLILKTNTGNEKEFFVEECEDDEVCSQPWQTGECGPKGGCTLKPSFDFALNANDESISAFLVTDRNDGGEEFQGILLDALMVEACPTEAGKDHCEAQETAFCQDGSCICEGGIPCACPCDGNSPRLVGKIRTGLVVGIVVPLFVVFFAVFLFYRRRKIQKSRAQKGVIEAKEAELEAFRNSVVGMRTAIVEFVPSVDGGVEHAAQPKTDETRTSTKGQPKIQWCWQETQHMMSSHHPDQIAGNPADCFIVYDGNASKKLETAFQAQGGKGKFSPMPGYVVDFEGMTQTKEATGFQRTVQRLVQVADMKSVESRLEKLDLSEARFGDMLPSELGGEPQMVLVKGDVVQISSQRQDGWAFGTKLYHSDEVVARELVKFASGGHDEDEANIFTDTGWFQMDATEVPSSEDLALLQNNVGDTGALDPPSAWDPISDPSVVQLHKISKSDDEYQSVVNAFMSTLLPPAFPKKARVVEIQRIQNLAMWQSYVVKRQTICYRETGQGAGGDKSAADQAIQQKALERFERRWLWHGTNVEVMDKIMQQGFNRSFCGKNATMYGKGVYFARDASYSAYPTYSVPDKNNHQYIMACRVVVGEYCPGSMNALTPDIRDAKSQSLYDTTVGLLRDDTMSNPSIYVTYHDAQAYPEYLMKFKLS